MTRTTWIGWIICVAGSARAVFGEAILENGGFEAWQPAAAAKAGRLHGWQLGQPPETPAGWSLNTAYPGQLAHRQTDAHSGRSFAQITAVPGKSAHLYQMCRGLQSGKWYRVSAWVRGGPVAVSCYEYGKARFLGTQTLAQTTSSATTWRVLGAFYRPPAGEYKCSALAICALAGQAVDVDDVQIETVATAEAAPNEADVVFQTEAFRLALTSAGIVREFRCQSSGENYAVVGAPLPILTAIRAGVAVPLRRLSRAGNLVRAEFVDGEVQARFRVTARKQHLLWEVVDAQPADLEQLTLDFPLRRFGAVASAFNGTYDERFGACLWGLTVNTTNRTVGRGSDVVSLTSLCSRKHGLAGAKFALVAAPGAQFKPALVEAERANGLPCPMLEGRWARDSEPVRRSYLFVVDASEANVERSIEYAKLGGFGLILFLKDNWLSTHGHYQINTRNFPDGLPSLKRAVAKIHAAGLAAGVHVFGPSISPNDPYVTPKPDDRLVAISLPPLAADIDAKATAIPLAATAEPPPALPRRAAFSAAYLRVGDELIRYQEVEAGPPCRYIGCVRGALGTQAAAHRAGAPVRALPALWSYFLIEPDSTLADEVTARFGQIVNDCELDMVYFDASDGIGDGRLDRWYYLNKLHLGYYRHFRRDVLYQTSNGTGSDLCWHIVPRSASADGHGDLKGYLDARWPGILGMQTNLTRPDVGWYYMYDDVRADQIEYVCAKVLGVDGSISIETSHAALEKHAYARRMMEMLNRYEQCRLARHFPESVRTLLRAPQQEFRLFGQAGQWKLYRTAYAAPRVVERLDGRQNVWTITNPRPTPCTLAVEITGGRRGISCADYDQPGAVTVEAFADATSYQVPPESLAERLLGGTAKTRTPTGPAREGVTPTLKAVAKASPTGQACLEWTAHSAGDHGGWCATGRRFTPALNLRGNQALALWVHGDGFGENLRLQFRDAAGRSAVWRIPIGFHGWRLCAFRTAEAAAFDWSKVEYLLCWLERLSPGMKATLRLADLKALPTLHATPPLTAPTLEVNGRKLVLPVQIAAGQGLTVESPAGASFWPGGMQPSQTVNVSLATMVLQPGENQVTFTADTAAGYPGDVAIVLSQLWPLEN